MPFFRLQDIAQRLVEAQRNAAILTTFSFVPQVLRVWRTRSTADISLGMYSVYTFGIALWGVYGVLLDSWPIILSNALTFLFAGSVLVMKVLCFALFACASPLGWLSLLCPASILYFLLRVTGIPATEEQALRTKGDAYRAYQEMMREHQFETPTAMLEYA